MRLHTVGCKVLITQDCRDGERATGKTGIYEGDFPFSVCVKVSEDDFREYLYEDWVSGKITLSDGRRAIDVVPQLNREGMEPPFWFQSDNPRIRLEDGSVIWGCQCWWCAADEQGNLPTIGEGQQSQENTIAALRGLLDCIKQ